eukprot:6490719-Amphidinium_carterae.1
MIFELIQVPPEELSKAPHPGFSTSPGLGELDYPGFSPFSCPEVPFGRTTCLTAQIEGRN